MDKSPKAAKRTIGQRVRAAVEESVEAAAQMITGDTIPPAPPERYTVQYRTGGTLNYHWHGTLLVADSPEKLHDDADSILRMGYPVRIVPLGTPLPITFEVYDMRSPGEFYGPQF